MSSKIELSKGIELLHHRINFAVDVLSNPPRGKFEEAIRRSRKHAEFSWLIPPKQVYDMIRRDLKEAMELDQHLELFARNSIHGWTCWGKETGYWLDENGVTILERPVTPGEEIQREIDTQIIKGMIAAADPSLDGF